MLLIKVVTLAGALRMQYQNEVGQSFLEVQTQQQEVLGHMSNSLSALVDAVNRVATAAEHQAMTLDELKEYLVVRLYFLPLVFTFPFSHYFRPMISVQ